MKYTVHSARPLPTFSVFNFRPFELCTSASSCHANEYKRLATVAHSCSLGRSVMYQCFCPVFHRPFRYHAIFTQLLLRSMAEKSATRHTHTRALEEQKIPRASKKPPWPIVFGDRFQQIYKNNVKMAHTLNDEQIQWKQFQLRLFPTLIHSAGATAAGVDVFIPNITYNSNTNNMCMYVG